MGCSSGLLLTSIHLEMELKAIPKGGKVFVACDLRTYTHLPVTGTLTQTGCVRTVQVYHFRRYITFWTWLFCDRCSCCRSGMQTKRTFCFTLKTDGFTARRKFTRQRDESAEDIRAHWTPRLSSLQEIRRHIVFFFTGASWASTRSHLLWFRP